MNKITAIPDARYFQIFNNADTLDLTPRNVMKMVVEMIAPQVDEKILDSSCGTGGFPVIAMTYVMDAPEKIFVDEFQTSRADWNDDFKRGLAKIFNTTSENFRNANSIALFDVIVTNPPFGR